MRTFRRIAIVGGGAAAATLLGELFQRNLPQPLHLDWYTGGGRPGPGLPYSTTSVHHLLNVRAASMSMFSGRPRGFLDFLQRDDPEVAGIDFVPRARYGAYLDAEVARTLEWGRSLGHDVHVVPATVDALVPEQDRVTVFHGDSSHQVDAAVLAVGALPPQPLVGVTSRALTSERYVVDPWPMLAATDNGAPPRKVVLIGLGLTAVDVVLELAQRWPEAEFTAVSRHGLLPEHHLHAASAPTDDGASLIEAMLDMPAIRPWLRMLREAITQEDDWRTVIDGLRPHAPTLWRALDQEQRARFLRHALWAWQRARHRMPPQSAAAIATLQRHGRLHCSRGRLSRVDVLGSQLQLTLVGEASLQADLVIQATGLNIDVRQSRHRLVSQLLTNGHIRADPLGLGVLADDVGRLVHGDRTWPNLFALGSLLRGVRWESNAMPEICQQARQLADELLAVAAHPAAA